MKTRLSSPCAATSTRGLLLTEGISPLRGRRLSSKFARVACTRRELHASSPSARRKAPLTLALHERVRGGWASMCGAASAGRSYFGNAAAFFERFCHGGLCSRAAPRTQSRERFLGVGALVCRRGCRRMTSAQCRGMLTQMGIPLRCVCVGRGSVGGRTLLDEPLGYICNYLRSS